MCSIRRIAISLTITKGGVGKYTNLTNGTEQYDLNWEVKDEVLVTLISFFGMEHNAVLELNEDGTVLNVIQVGFPAYVEGGGYFYKEIKVMERTQVRSNFYIRCA